MVKSERDKVIGSWQGPRAHRKMQNYWLMTIRFLFELYISFEMLNGRTVCGAFVYLRKLWCHCYTDPVLKLSLSKIHGSCINYFVVHFFNPVYFCSETHSVLAMNVGSSEKSNK